MDINNTTDFGKVKILLVEGAKGEKGDKGDDGDYVAQQYTSLMNKPSIDGTTLDGAMTASDLGLATDEDVANVVGKLSSFSNNFATEYFEKSVGRIEANSVAGFAQPWFTITKTGYKPISVIQYGCQAVITSMSFDDDAIGGTLWNPSSTAIDPVVIRFTILYIKEDIS